MPFERKLALVPHEIENLQSAAILPNYTKDGTAQYWSSHRRFDVAEWLNRGVIRRLTWARALDAALYWHY
jgi:hypothetical protein